MKTPLSIKALLFSLASLGVATSVIESKELSKRFGLGGNVTTSQEDSLHINITKKGNVLSYVYTILPALTRTESNKT